MSLAQINGTEIFYRSVGAGWPCFILHGGLGLDHTYLHPWLSPLGDQLQLIYYDQRGNGRSGRPPLDTLTFAQFCADIEALRIHLGFDRIALLGHSYGGFIGLEYARRYPDRVSHLILVDTVAATNFDDDIQANLQRINPPPESLAALASEPTTDAELQQVLQAITPLYFHTFDAALAQAAFQHIVWSVTANSAGFAIMSDYNMLPHLSEIQAPALCIVGDSDFLALVPHVQLLARGLPHADIVVIDHCGHMPFIERPDAFLQAVATWLRQWL
jgi:proline iminopeptidase